MEDIIFISQREELLDPIKLNATMTDYYKFVDATARLVNAAKQCSPSTFTDDEVVVDVVKITKKRDATTALFTDAGLKTIKTIIVNCMI